MRIITLISLLFIMPVMASEINKTEIKSTLTIDEALDTISYEKKDKALFDYFLPLAHKGDMKAQHELALLYYSGKGVPPDLNQAIKFWTLAAEQGHIEAQYELATILLYAENKTSIQESIYWYTLAAEQGHTKAMYELAWIYQSGTFTPQSDEKTFYWYQALADEKVSAGQLNLGIMYLEGRFVQHDIEQALFWLNQAAQQKHPEAMLQLGLLYTKGVGIKPNPKKAFDLYKQSAQKGNIDAQFYLARMYSQGESVEKNSILAYVWFKIAIKNYHSPAITEWLLLKEKMKPEQIKKAENTLNTYLEDKPNLIWKLTLLY